MNYLRLAQRLDALYRDATDLDRDLAAAGFSSWRDDSPRRAALAALEQWAEVRRILDRLAVAAGGEAATAFVRRNLRPALETKIAATQAQREQHDHELAAQVERERRSALYGRRGWATRQEGAA
jgi:hypothetical protein